MRLEITSQPPPSWTAARTAFSSRSRAATRAPAFGPAPTARWGRPRHQASREIAHPAGRGRRALRRVQRSLADRSSSWGFVRKIVSRHSLPTETPNASARLRSAAFCQASPALGSTLDFFRFSEPINNSSNHRRLRPPQAQDESSRAGAAVECDSRGGITALRPARCSGVQCFTDVLSIELISSNCTAN